MCVCVCVCVCARVCVCVCERDLLLQQSETDYINQKKKTFDRRKLNGLSLYLIKVFFCFLFFCWNRIRLSIKIHFLCLVMKNNSIFFLGCLKKCSAEWYVGKEKIKI